jgi:hypothetical protein
MAERFLAWANHLSDLIAALDRDSPGWRALPEAK